MQCGEHLLYLKFCLSPHIPCTRSMPSIFFIKVLLDRDIVLVTINYRLGPLGWLSLETDAAPGKLALVAALATPICCYIIETCGTMW